MPTITISKKDLDTFLGKKISIEELHNLLFSYLKGEVKDSKDDEINIEFEESNRADLFSAEGFARALRPLLGLSKGLPNYPVKKGNYKVIVDSSIKKIRPYIACAVVRNIKMTDSGIKSLIQLQEKLDETFGRKRKKTSIGIYDFNKITFPVNYKLMSKDTKFVALGFDKELPSYQILEQHPKGKEYGSILSNLDEFPFLVDSKGKILSMPPIINSNDLGKVEESSTDLFVEVTGTDEFAVKTVLNVVASTLAERGGQLESVKIKDGDNLKTFPDFSPLEFTISLSDVWKILGFALSEEQLKDALYKMGYEILKINVKKGTITILAPFNRIDILHPVDIIEDILIGYGFDNIPPNLPNLSTRGSYLDITYLQNNVRECLIGMSFQEILTFILSNKDIQSKFPKIETNLIELKNPTTMTYNALRANLFPQILNFLSKNTTVEFPHKVFEVGEVASFSEKSNNYSNQETHLCVAISHSKAGFTEIHSVLDVLLKNLNKKYEIKPEKFPFLIEGRSANIFINNDLVGFIGEVHPEVLLNFGIEMPVTLFEIKLRTYKSEY